jgi:hypothetical protein
MAFVAMQSTHITGGVAGENLIEGLAVTMSASGLHNDLPTVMIAASGSKNVFIAMVPPDQYPRPTPQGMFSRNYFNKIDPRNAAEFLIDSGQNGPYYLVGPSLLNQPTVLSGWMVQLHKGGAYHLTPACFVDSADIRNAGATVCVTTGGKFAYSTSNVVGYVREYRDGNVTIVLDARSA